MILFLDFDGVLHKPHGPMTQFMQHLHHLNALLRKHPHVRVVIASSWRVSQSFNNLRAHFPEDLRARVVGVTPVLRQEQGDVHHRERECLAWLAANAPGEAWLAIDDEPTLFASSERVVICQPHRGIADEAVLQELNRRLGKRS